MSWTEVASEFARDGSLRDIYVLNTTLGDWQRILDALRASGAFAVSYCEDGEAAPIPSRIEAIFERGRDVATLLRVRRGGILFNGHFFCEERIEFDIDPHEVRGEEDFQLVLDFMGLLAGATDKAAILTSENAHDEIILTVQPPG